MLSLILVVAIAGFLVYLITTYIPMPPVFKTVCIGIAVLCIILYAIQVLGHSSVSSSPLLR